MASVFTLAMGAEPVEAAGPLARWTGRNWEPDVVALEIRLETRLLALRNAHMQWVYETGKQLGPKLEPNSPLSMWWTSLIYERHPKLSPHLYTIYKLACVEEWLTEGGASELRLIGGSPKVSRALRKMCAQAGIKFIRIKEKNTHRKIPGHMLYRALPAPVRALTRFAYWYAAVRRKLPPIARLAPYRDPQRKSATIVTYFPNINLEAAASGRFISRYWEALHQLLNEEAKRENGAHFVRWLFIRFPAPGLSLDDCITFSRKFQNSGIDGLSFSFLEEFITTKGILKSLARWLRLNFASLAQEKTFARSCNIFGGYLNFWPWIKWEYGESFRGWRCLERCLFNEAFLRYCQIAGPQRWTLYALENCPWERMLNQACGAIEGNGPVIGAQHSSIRPTDFRYFDDARTFNDQELKNFQPDLVAGNGKSACSQWRQNNMPKNALTEVEALRYLYLSPRHTHRSVQPKRLLIATSFFRDETEAHLRLASAALTQEILREWEVVWKPHPYLIPLEWLNTLPEDLRNTVHLSTLPIEQEISVGPLVWASNSTTVSLEAIIAQLPVMVMSAYDDFDLCPVQDVPGLIRTATVSDVENGLKIVRPLDIASDYLDLNTGLPKWRALLNLMCQDS